MNEEASCAGRGCPRLCCFLVGLLFLGSTEISAIAQAQLFTNLQTLVYELPAGISSLSNPNDGPKAITTADFDNDGKADLAIANTDGSVALYFGKGAGRFEPIQLLHTGARSLRDIVAADFDGDGRPDIAITAPFQTNVLIFYNQSVPGVRQFQPAVKLQTWFGARNLAAGDFDGDGRQDLVVAGPNNGLRQYRSLGGRLGDDSFQVMTNISDVNVITLDPSRFPKPVYSLKTFRPPTAVKDHLVITHADTPLVWSLSPGPNGVLRITGHILNHTPAHYLDVAPLLTSRSNNGALPDLVTVHRDAGYLEIHAGLWNGPDNYAFAPVGSVDYAPVFQHIDVPGGPRAVEIVDLNADGWNDLVVVARNSDSIFTYANTNGALVLATERPVGSSPRELVAAHFNRETDAFPDLAVMNRNSADISILLAATQQVGYRGVNHLYLVDGNVVGLTLMDFNGDGRPDVIQLHRASGDFSVRLTNPDGTLGQPTYYTLGNIPSAQVFQDVNGDGVPDQVSTHLGTPGVEQGFVSVRLGRRDAANNLTFNEEKRFYLPADVTGRLFALVLGRFSGERYDLVAGFLDGRVAFFKGNGDGTFSYAGYRRFANQPRDLVVGDFDHDGDPDLAGVGINGEMWVMENPGGPANETINLINAVIAGDPLNVQVYPPPAPAETSFGGRRILAVPRGTNLDLIIGSGKGAWVYQDGPGMSFVTPPRALAGSSQLISDVLLADLDHDGNPDVILSCQGLDCLSFFSQTNHGIALPLNAPATHYIASADLDGDGKPDLVGTGRVLWTALSGHTNQDTAPLTLVDQRSRLTNIVINELLAINTSLPVDEDGDRTVDWLELYNGSTVAVNLPYWKLRAVKEDHGVSVTNEYLFPNTAFFAPGAHLLLFCSDEQPPRTYYHTGFKLSGDGGSLELINPAGAVVDRLDYPAQRPNISYARFRDGQRSFAFNPFPSPGRENVFNGLSEPVLKFGGVDPTTFAGGLSNRFYVDVSADVGVSSVRMYYQNMSIERSEVQVLQLFDDGMHDDGEAGDGRFACTIEGSLPANAEIQFYFVVTDLNDQTIQVPDEAEFGSAGTPGNAYQLAFLTSPSFLELSELVALNHFSLLDGTNGTPDWIEVRNTGSTTISLDDISVSQQIGDAPRFTFPTGMSLPPGGCTIIYCDSNLSQGARHAPFRLNNEGDMVMLTGLTANHSRTLLDWVRSPELDIDEAYARLGAGGNWRKTAPTPWEGNLPATWLGFMETNGNAVGFTFAFRTATNASYTVERASDLNPGTSWTPVQTFVGDGIEKVIHRPTAGSEFFRVVKTP